MIEHPDGEHLAALLEASRNFLIFLTWHRISGRMIVDEHDRSGGRISEAVSVPVEITLYPLILFLLLSANRTKCSLSASSSAKIGFATRSTSSDAPVRSPTSHTSRRTLNVVTV